jgi:glycerol-3-phosphate acyltransferase PlsY
MRLVLFVVLSFVLGSIPFGVVLARVKGVDLKKVGSGNIGATNVLRTMGKGPAILTLMGDIMKGAVPVIAGMYVFHDLVIEGVLGLAAILGHNFSLFLRLRGGKGVATSIGVLLVYSPKVALVTIVIWLTVIIITRYSSLGALCSFSVLPLTMYFLDSTKEKVIVSCIMSGLLILRHADNIKRLLQGAESKIGKRA